MARPNTSIISGPFDVRHVGGVSIPGVTTPIAGIARASTVLPTLEPDEAPSHTYAATGRTEVPRRSNSIANSLRRPSLGLKTSISLLRGRSNSSFIDGTSRRKSINTIAHSDPTPFAKIEFHPTQSLRKKPSSSSLWQRTHADAPARQPPIPQRPRTATPEAGEKAFSLTQIFSIKRKRQASNPYEFHPVPQSPPPPLPPPLEEKPSMRASPSTPPPSPPPREEKPYMRTIAPVRPGTAVQSLPVVRPATAARIPPVVRPKRADSGTGIEFDNELSVSEQPLGFKEILAKNSYAERMAHYKSTREYWARADHGLHEWVEKAGAHQPLVFPV